MSLLLFRREERRKLNWSTGVAARSGSACRSFFDLQCLTSQCQQRAKPKRGVGVWWWWWLEGERWGGGRGE